MIKYQRTNITADAPAPQKRPMTNELFHGYLGSDPPNCKAARNMAMAGARSAKPPRSRLDSNLRTRESEKGSCPLVSGMLLKAIKTAAQAPMGRLM